MIELNNVIQHILVYIPARVLEPIQIWPLHQKVITLYVSWSRMSFVFKEMLSVSELNTGEKVSNNEKCQDALTYAKRFLSFFQEFVPPRTFEPQIDQVDLVLHQ